MKQTLAMSATHDHRIFLIIDIDTGSTGCGYDSGSGSGKYETRSTEPQNPS